MTEARGEFVTHKINCWQSYELSRLHSLKGFKETPTTAEVWLAAVRACAELDVKEEKNRFGRIRYSVTLKDHKGRLHC